MSLMAQLEKVVEASLSALDDKFNGRIKKLEDRVSALEDAEKPAPAAKAAPTVTAKAATARGAGKAHDPS